MSGNVKGSAKPKKKKIQNHFQLQCWVVKIRIDLTSKIIQIVEKSFFYEFRDY